ncbi:hypothetical protein M427DRAFT_385077 [Gonapodya prolifera JEL478]|uniref:Uncharacterized protein n=1 Tax=Gonapodya prolifera (strain JEL478) TaxID=1344416 RepID=A0A139A9I6_GONPJ|nr:hypothetical protein M427DRAFT_385077 [Gonapodya prolifera JEL478]|eukprot:KXS13063.1 hypothetical protein M427DRAFT_385077 [Gonapodya prolifera JEL478]
MGAFLSATAQIIERVYSGVEQLEKAGKDKSGDQSAFERDTDEVSDTEQDVNSFNESHKERESELSKQLRLMAQNAEIAERSVQFLGTRAKRYSPTLPSFGALCA